jgi:hypothetical protein
MTLTEFKSSLRENTPPIGVSIYLLSLWYDGKGDWDKAHALVDSLPGQDAARVHAYLHRKEGDLSNANYWYRRADLKMPASDLEVEWDVLVTSFL